MKGRCWAPAEKDHGAQQSLEHKDRLIAAFLQPLKLQVTTWSCLGVRGMGLAHRLCSDTSLRWALGDNSVITLGSVAPEPFLWRILHSLKLQNSRLLVLCMWEKGPWIFFFFCFRKLGKRKQSGTSPRWAWAGLGSGIPGDTGLWAGYSTGKYKFLDLMIFFVIILLRSGNFSSQWCLNLGLLIFWLSLVIHRDYSFFFAGGGVSAHWLMVRKLINDNDWHSINATPLPVLSLVNCSCMDNLSPGFQTLWVSFQQK